MKNNIEFASRCEVELYDEGNGITVFRCDTRLIGGDFTMFSIPSPFATEASARLKLFEFLCEIDR